MENIMSELIGQKLTEQFEMFMKDVDAEIDSKECSVCYTVKAISLFKDREPGIANSSKRSECRQCTKEATQLVQQLAIKNPRPVEEDYKCPCCSKLSEDLKRYGRWQDRSAWVLDHDHTTKKFRAWICQGCNLGLGRFSDNIDNLKKAINYLERFNNE